MSRSPKWSPRLAVLAAAARRSSSAACAAARPQRPRRAAPSTRRVSRGQSAARRARRRRSRRIGLPRSRRRGPCGTGAAPEGSPTAPTRATSRRSRAHRREDRRVRALQPGRRLPVEDRVHRVRDQRHRLPRSQHRPGGGDQAIVDRAERHRAVQARTPGAAAPRSCIDGATTTTGATAPLTPTRRSSAGAPRPPSGSSSSRPGTVDGIDNPGPDDFDDRSRATPTCTLDPREGLNILYLGFNNTFAPFDNEKVRQAIAMGIDRQRIVDNFYPPGSEVATHFTPCAIPFGCDGDEWYEFDAGRRQGSCWPRPASRTASRPRIQLPRRRPRLPARSRRRRARRSRPSSRPTSASPPTIDVQESRHVPRQRQRRRARRAPPARLGRRLSGCDQLPRLPLRLGCVRRSSATSSTTSPTPLDDGRPRRRRRPPARPPTRRPTTPSRTHVPMIPIAHGGSATGVPGRRRQARTRSPLGNELFAVMTPGDRRPARLDAERRAARPVLRRRDRRRVAPRLRADQGGALRLRDRRHGRDPVAGDGVRGQRGPRRSGPAPCARASRSTTARRSTRTTSCSSLRRPVGRRASAPRRSDGRLVRRTSPASVRWVPEPAAAGRRPADRSSQPGAATGGARRTIRWRPCSSTSVTERAADDPVHPPPPARQHPGPARDRLPRLRRSPGSSRATRASRALGERATPSACATTSTTATASTSRSRSSSSSTSGSSPRATSATRSGTAGPVTRPPPRAPADDASS